MKKLSGFLICFSLLAALVSCHRLEVPGHGEPKQKVDVNTQMLKVSRDTIRVTKEFSYHLNAAVYPSDAVEMDIIWRSLDEKIASVNDTGLVYGVEVGRTMVVAMTEDGGFADTCIVDILKNVHVEQVVIIPSDTTVYLGANRVLLKAKVLPEDSRVQDVVWATDDPTIATVDEFGRVQPMLIEGTAKITATSVDGGKVGVCNFTVSRKKVTSITLNKTELSVAPGATAYLKATIVPADATYPEVVWGSTNPAFASVDESGVVTGVAVGSTTITATTVDGGLTASCAVTVQDVQTKTVTLTFDLSKCPESMAGSASALPNGEYLLPDASGTNYSFSLYRGYDKYAFPSYTSYLVVNIANYIGTPVIPNGKLTKFTFTQAAPTKSRKSAMTTQTHDGAMSASYYDASIEADGVSVQTATQGASYTFTIKSPENGKRYYFVVGGGGVGISKIVLTYEVEVKPQTLKFDLTKNPGGWPTADTPHVDGGSPYIYKLDGKDYTFIFADCNNGATQVSSTKVFWNTNGYFVLNGKYRYLGLPAIPGYKLTQIVVTHATTAKARNVRVSDYIAALNTIPNAVPGGEPQDFNVQGKVYTFILTDSKANTVYYLHADTTGVGFSYIELTYDPE